MSYKMEALMFLLKWNWLPVLIVFLTLGVITQFNPAPTAEAASPDTQDGLEIFTRDIFVIVGSTLRNPDATTVPTAPLFNVAGVALNLTWGQWQQASATATAHVTGGENNSRSDVRIRLSGLVPGGVYSVFYINLNPDSENALCPNVERSLPLTAFHPDRQSPDASSFVADANGEAVYRGQVDGDLLNPMQLIFSIIYHFDGRTYGSLPNRGEFLTQGATCRSSFGEDAMRQLLILQKQ
jgi:hypothetical protein